LLLNQNMLDRIAVKDSQLIAVEQEASPSTTLVGRFK
jgi:hypothetical protein